MAPHSVLLSTFDHQRFTDKDKFKLRKPMVEKMRRDRINNCIDQLKKLLENELRRQDPNTKLEKADILEMTVTFLKQQQRCPEVLSQRDYNQGYSQCWRESLHFLNVHSNGRQSTQEVQQIHERSRTELSHGSSVHSSKHSHGGPQQASKPVWRPW
ncbi:transcription factor HES-5-like [Clarias magur]|uniref:Transcription factor HES-5 n=1 Tax=Clarias magur TaxID=1594786 RepID=A0A8J4X5L1_CLAMG|nr:transcription factor HES-5-like [Clarias magur]